MTKQQKIFGGVVLVAVIAIVFLLYMLFKPAPVNKEVELTKQLIEAKNETITAVKGEREAWEQYAASKDTMIAYLKSQTALSLEAVAKNKVFYIENKKKYEAIPGNVRNLSKDSLRRAVVEFQ